MDEITFLITLIDENWTNATVDVDGNAANGEVNAFGDNCPGTSSHRAKPLLIDIKNFTPNQGRRVDLDSTDIILFYEDSASITHPTIDWSVRNEEYTFTLHIRTLQPKGQADLTFARTRLQSLYQIVRYIIEKKGLRPSISAGNSAELLQITGRSDANDRGKRLLGYKLTVNMKRFGRPIVS
tara:strand:- start:105 stop:650 length:546 start_codon:yes stop_codon:yes gene_type:complete